jgi:hypothetical protein
MKKIIVFCLALLLAAAPALPSGAMASAPWELDPEVEGRVTFFGFNGERILYEDIGHAPFDADHMFDSKLAELVAVARLFNARYPNVKINYYAITGEPNEGEISYQQERENFRNEYGFYPDAWVVQDLTTDVKNGTAADLSRFAGEAMYDSFNKTLMDMANYDGVQAGLPSYITPWVFPINISLAEKNNIEVPPVNWTFDEYVDFVSQADMTAFFGDIDAHSRMITAAAGTIARQFTLNGRIDFNTDEVKRMIDLLAKAAEYAVWSNYPGKVTDSIMNRYWWWDGMFFCKNALLLDNWGSWLLSFFADPTSQYHMMADRWDVYPFPKANRGDDNNLLLVYDPIVIRNYAMDGADTALNDTRLAVTYAFISMFLADSEAIAARAAAQYTDVNIDTGKTKLMTAVFDSLPVVSGAAFEAQMEIWYASPSHASMKDAAAMPGWHEVMRIYNAGEFACIDGRTSLIRYFENGENKSAFEEWDDLANAIEGVAMIDPGWADQIKSKLGEWTALTNERLEKAELEMKDALARYYGR